MKVRFTLPILFLIFLSTSVFAKHIIGGIITYEYKDNGKYSFTMKIYRDCNSGGAVLDGDSGDTDFGKQQFAKIGVFREFNGVFTRITNLDVLLKSKDKVLPPDYPCMALPPNVCVEEGVYNFDFTIPDFPSQGTYHFVYQRCCRNNSISNIIKPEDVGATYTVAITPQSMLSKNSSPVFKEFPPTVLCSTVPFKFDHSATDKDGNKLVYSFCSPLEGGGPNLSGSDCGSARPIPCPPPFTKVKFENGYTAAQPLSALANLKIDPDTGIMTGEPTVEGQFVVGICVKEYDANGNLLGEIFRDFQFNITKCDALVLAGVKSTDTSIVLKKYTIRACGFDEIKFQNGSVQEKYIKSYLWNFDVNGTTVTSTEKNPTIKFPGLGIYTGYMVANPGLKPCSDTAKIEVQVYPGIKADFKYVYDTCKAAPVQFTDLSTSGAGSISKWTWKFGDGSTSGKQNINYEYKTPGNFSVKLQVEDKNKCVDTITKKLPYFPVPPLLIVKPDTAIGCNPITMKIANLSYPIDKSYTILWDFGDNTTSNEISPIHTYKDAGTYTVNLKVTSPIGCTTQSTFPNLVDVRQSPTADFEYSPDKLNSLQSTAKFTDKSLGASKWTWQFGTNEGSSIIKSPTYTFQDTGLHQVRLIVTHLSGCRDTALKVIDIEPVIKYFLPNAFTPNYDSSNDEFKGTGIYTFINQFNMTIYNRWGEKVFETKDIEEGWNGRVNNTGDNAPDGVYVYHVNFIGPRNKPFSYKGFATLIR